MTGTDEQPPVVTPNQRKSRGSVSALERVRVWGRSGTVETGAFWLAVGLPLVYLPVLAIGLDGRGAWFQFVALLVLHVVCLIVGHPHRT